MGRGQTLVLVFTLGAVFNLVAATTVGHASWSNALTSYGASSSSVEVRLGIDKKSVGLGGAVRVRIENFGTQDVAYGYEYELARFKNGSWVRLPVRPVFMPRLNVRRKR